jgi:hypothetical protein
MIQSLYLASKSGFRAALFLMGLCACMSVVLAEEKNVSQSPVWLSLLHSDGVTSAISDPTFLLSGKNFSPRQELNETLSFLYSGDPSHVCRFPARYLWLKSQLDLPVLDVSQCHDLQEFLKKAPVQHVSLVFASESLAQPASMMGHSFLKLSGQTTDGIDVSHAITFFTEAEGYNLPKLFLESTVLGKQGFFALSPFDEELNRYLKKEQRKVWFYDLAMDAATRQLIQYHLQELKQTKLVYFFQSYNCATLLRHVLALSGQLPASPHLWVSPKDVVQDLSQAGLVQSVSVDSPSGWLVRVLSDQMPPDSSEAIAQQIRQGRIEALQFAPNNDQDYLRFSLAQAYASYLQTEYPQTPFIAQTKHQLAALDLYPDKQLQTSVALNPANSPPDSQWSFSTVGEGANHRQRIGLLPASHWLMDNNSAYTQETELQLMGVTAYIDQNQRVGLDRLTLYKMQSYTPYNPMVGGVSSKFLIQWGGSPFQPPNASKGWVLSSAVGRTYQVSKDVDLFGFAGLGYDANKSSDHLPLTVEVGAIVREVSNMKTVVSYERRHDFFNQPLVKEQLQIDQSKYVARDFTLFARLRQSLSGPIRFKEWELGFKQLF